MYQLFFVAVFLTFYASATPHVLRQASQECVPPSKDQIQMDLGPQLSPGAMIFFPDESQFANATARWSGYREPNISVVVEPATPDDVSATVRYANKINLPFLAVSRGHGSPVTLSTIQNGIEIWLSQFDKVEIAEDGQTAIVQGGVDVQTAVETLDAQGKASSTGACACVGILGSGLGGGHGRLQGFHGLIADNILEANVVLWNGTQIVVSKDSYPDLFWGLRGAGHNFGIVTSVRYQIYDRSSPVWYTTTFVYQANQLEDVFDILNKQREAVVPPAMSVRTVLFLWNANVSTTEPTILLDFNYVGTEEEAAPLLEPFQALNPIVVLPGAEVPYPVVLDRGGTGLQGPLCAKGLQRLNFAVELTEYNLTAVRASFEAFGDLGRAYPPAQASSIVWENYALNAFKAVPPEDTAYAHRGTNHQLVLGIAYEPGSVPDEEMIRRGEEIRGILHDGQKPGTNLDVYLNYAFGTESLESVYGYEPWRLERLRGLKKSYDPENKFSGYMPIY